MGFKGVVPGWLFQRMAMRPHSIRAVQDELSGLSKKGGGMILGNSVDVGVDLVELGEESQ